MLVLLGLVLALIAVLMPAVAFAQSQEEPSGAQTLLAGGMLLVFLVICLASYVYVSLALQTIAKKTNTENAWMAWIPILGSIIVPVLVSKKPGWWILLCFIPLVGIVIGVIVWMAVAEARGKPNWWGILIIVPLVQLIVPGYLAWSD